MQADIKYDCFHWVKHSVEYDLQLNSQEDNGHQSSGARAPELWCPHLFF